ncbi:MAG: cytochrome c oxidase subunit II [Bryobacteraceae bacterium]|nr:cytochrome c oxidase subunit II [Bryobacteraceae bacterium]
MRFLPPAASTGAESVDSLYYFLVALTLLFAGGIFLTVTYFAIRYRRRDPRECPRPVHGGALLESAWIAIPLVIVMFIFGWGAKVYYDLSVPPKDALQLYVIGKQWMWKAQHPDGQREINELHVPLGRPVRIVMTSQDVIHSFYIPAFRLKRDVVPGSYTTMWFTPTKVGRFRLFCAEYCGTEHSKMIGWVTVMEPTDFERWLSGAGAEGSMAEAGEKLFQRLGCAGCHRTDAPGRCPPMTGVFGSSVVLATGQTVIADEQYVRESILNPKAKIVAGYQPVMPSYQGQVTEDQLLSLIAYIRSLAAPGTTETGTTAAQPQAAPPAPQPRRSRVSEGATTITQPERRQRK